MAKEKFFPVKEQLKAAWQKNLGIKIGPYKVKYGVPNADETRIQDGGVYAEFILDSIEAADTFKQSMVNYKNIMFDGVPAGVDPATVVLPVINLPATPATTPPPGIFKHALSVGTGIKKKLNYIVADGEDMGLEGAVKPAPDTVNGQPEIKAVLKGANVWILWLKGLFSGLWIEVDRGDGQGWQKIGMDYVPDWMDTVPLPAQAAQWKYRAWYVIFDEGGNDVRVGVVSDTVSITVKA